MSVTDIKTLAGALAVHVDAREWDELTELFAPEVHVDYTSLFGGDRATMPRERLIAQWRGLLPGFDQTTHLIGAPMVTVSGERASLRASVVAWRFIRDVGFDMRDHWIVGGCYEMELTRIDAHWRIASLTLARAWQQGNTELPTVATRRATTTAGEG